MTNKHWEDYRAECRENQVTSDGAGYAVFLQKRIAELEAREQWVRVADKEPPKGVEVWIKGPLFELRATEVR